MKLIKKEMLNLEEACVYTGLSKSWMYQLCHKRIIPFYKPGRKKSYFKRDDLDMFLQRNRQETIEELNSMAIENIEKKIDRKQAKKH